ncbi:MULTISPECIES: acetyl-CoA C-acetyltransferase [unclassified Paenibacillus]|uniref:acetyl-CoA C-acetyltransferase n=1 Tax=unclassified Paenibacillus TaxID=185978 RepID=UPI001AE15387|nr:MULTISPECIES: acetyl-CoA C-acetyltransferase [unclassified Paenibacillus]MBP1155733.1 acetyl-CoA C-acetyltransferase [Paenibacillus sp. PvP091]MBP1168881.1 acetyl-CoA C-acetyltransferase [Paenibacillus sp. PvR098]MBP2439909.1 acetyl-CoA C-acetyltransferase [Paenibacillus sp. PvP052]
MGNHEVYLIDGARTAFGDFGGSLKNVSAIELAVESAKRAMERASVAPEEIDQVILGNVIQSSTDAIYMGRHVGLKSGVPEHVPGLTVNRLCGSGLQAIVNAAQSIILGESDLALAGGAENMSQVPHVIRGARWGIPLGKATMEDYLWEALYDPYGDCTMAMTAENLAVQYGITREEVDAFALRSQERAITAIEKGIFAEEIVPFTVKGQKGDTVVNLDEHPRKTTMEALAKLPARFTKKGVVTAGNASGINDGAAMTVIASEDAVKRSNLKPIARLVSWGIVGVEPKIMGIGPVEAIRQALNRAGMSIHDLDLIEINEAFAAQYLSCQKELGFDPELGNVNGGAVALGHPLGASGARITLSLMYELRRRNKKFGVSSLCIGGGQGIAAIWERV